MAAFLEELTVFLEELTAFLEELTAFLEEWTAFLEEWTAFLEEFDDSSRLAAQIRWAGHVLKKKRKKSLII